MIIFNEEIKDIIVEKTICYYTKEEGSDIALYEVYEKKLLHPNAKELAYVYKIDTRKLKSIKRIKKEAAPLVLLEAAQNNIQLLINLE